VIKKCWNFIFIRVVYVCFFMSACGRV